jgi:hypothetical protein
MADTPFTRIQLVSSNSIGSMVPYVNHSSTQISATGLQAGNSRDFSLVHAWFKTLCAEIDGFGFGFSSLGSLKLSCSIRVSSRAAAMISASVRIGRLIGRRIDDGTPNILSATLIKLSSVISGNFPVERHRFDVSSRDEQFTGRQLVGAHHQLP